MHDSLTGPESPVNDLGRPATVTQAKTTGNRGRPGHVAIRMPPDVISRTVHMPDAAWTVLSVTCDPGVMSVTDPLLVVRRHVDFLRVQSAICLLAR